MSNLEFACLLLSQSVVTGLGVWRLSRYCRAAVREVRLHGLSTGYGQRTLLAAVQRVERRLGTASLPRPVGARVGRPPEGVYYPDRVSAYPAELLRPGYHDTDGLDLAGEYSYPDYVRRHPVHDPTPDPVAPVTPAGAVTPHVTPDLSSEPAQVPPWWEPLDGFTGNASVLRHSRPGTAVATTPTEADETSPEKSRGEKSGSHVD